MKAKLLTLLFSLYSLSLLAQTATPKPIQTTTTEETSYFFILFIIIGILLFVGVILLLRFLSFGLWFRARMSGVKFDMTSIAMMRVKKVDADLVVKLLIMAKESGIEDERLSLDALVSHYLEGGDVEKVIDAVISAKNADLDTDTPKDKLNLDFQKAKSISLALTDKDIIKVVDECVNPRVIQTEKIDAFAKDGIQLSMKARITIKGKIDEIVGGAGIETVLAKVNEATVSVVGSKNTHQDIIESPQKIGEEILEAVEYGKGTAYKIISIDISGIEIGQNIQAHLDIEKAQAKYETEKAREQKMRAEAAEAHAHHIYVEAKVSEAIAEAFKKGHINVQQYQELKNTEADTKMRESLGKSEHDEDHH